MSIQATLNQPETGVSATHTGLGDTGSDCNFLNDDWAQKKGFVALAKCNQEFVTFYGSRFKVLRAYDLQVLITDDRGETRSFNLRFYGCKNEGIHTLVFGLEFYESTIAQYADYARKRCTYALTWPDDIEILTPKEFEEELNKDLDTQAQVLFIKKGECNCLRQQALCVCEGYQVSTYLQSNVDNLLVNSLVYYANTVQKGSLEVPEYLQEKGIDFSDVFDSNKALELPSLRGVEHAIDTEGTVPYRPLYNLSET